MDGWSCLIRKVPSTSLILQVRVSTDRESDNRMMLQRVCKIFLVTIHCKICSPLSNRIGNEQLGRSCFVPCLWTGLCKCSRFYCAFFLVQVHEISGARMQDHSSILLVLSDDNNLILEHFQLFSFFGLCVPILTGINIVLTLSLLMLPVLILFVAMLSCPHNICSHVICSYVALCSNYLFICYC